MSSSLFSETVILISEEVYRGKVKSQDANILKMVDELGAERIFSKNDILKVVYRDVTDKKELDKIIKEEKLKKGIVSEAKDESPRRWWQLFRYIPPKSWLQASARSALVPGWGQYFAGTKSDMKWYNLRNGRWVGALAFVSVVGAFSYSGSSAAAFQRTEKGYNGEIFNIALFATIRLSTDSSNQLPIILFAAQQSNEAFSPYQKAQNVANNAIILFGTLYGIQLIHSYFVGKKWQAEQEKQASTTTIDGKEVEMDWNLTAIQKGNASSLNYSRENFYEGSLSFRF